MAKGPASRLVLSPAGDEDIREILIWSREKFGRAAAVRYRVLLIQALRDVAGDPELAGSKPRPEMMVAGARTYHLALSRDNVRGGMRVKEPRHFIVYRRGPEGALEIGRVLHDSRDLERHLPEAYRLPDPG